MRGDIIVIRFVLLILVLSLVGCASATYEVTEEGVTKKITYRVLGKREFSDLKMNPNSGLVELGNSRADGGDTIELMKNLSELALKGAGP